MSDAVSIDLGEGKGRIEGHCSSSFEGVLETFVENFRSRNEVGASLAVTHEGSTVVDLWGGMADAVENKAWDENSVCIVFSSGKGITAMVANVLIDRGLLDPHQPVAEIWPEFACNGKERATVRMMLDHTVGVPAIRTPIKPNGYDDWDYMCELVAQQEPFWEPGSMQGYHAVTFSWTVGELIRRVTGKSVGANIQEILSQPLNLDLWCGLPEEIEPRVAPIIPGAMEVHPDTLEAIKDPASPQSFNLTNSGGWLGGGFTDINKRAAHTSELPAANTMSNGRGLAGAYRPFALGGSADGRKFVGADTLVGMEEVSAASNRNQMVFMRTAWSLGFMKTWNNRRARFGTTESLILGRRAFGHAGAGGSLGFADPEAGLSFGYAMNRMGNGYYFEDRSTFLADAAYRAAGFRSNSSGFWLR